METKKNEIYRKQKKTTVLIPDRCYSVPKKNFNPNTTPPARLVEAHEAADRNTEPNYSASWLVGLWHCAILRYTQYVVRYVYGGVHVIVGVRKGGVPERGIRPRRGRGGCSMQLMGMGVECFLCIDIYVNRCIYCVPRMYICWMLYRYALCCVLCAVARRMSHTTTPKSIRETCKDPEIVPTASPIDRLTQTLDPES